MTLDVQVLAEEIEELIFQRRTVSFAEMAHCWPEHFTDGPYEIGLSGNLMLWCGLSDTE
jgi:hypothetical protein